MKYVYFMRAANGEGPIKIGATYCLMQRLYALKYKYGKDLVIMAFAEGSHELENRLHRGFKAYRIEGEWFEPCEPLINYINLVIRTGALPTPPEDARTSQMAKMYRGGATLQEIGDKFGLTHERVRQLLRKDGIESLGRRPEHKTGNIKINRIDREQFAMDYRSGITLEVLADAYGVSSATIRKLIRQMGLPMRGRKSFQRHELAARAADLYRRGVRVREITKSLCLPSTSEAYRLMRHAGVTPTRKSRRAA